MASYRVVVRPSVRKDLRSIPKATVHRILERIESLVDDPRPQKSAKLTGAEDLYRLRVGDYRIIYGVDDDAKMVAIHHVRHRREAYRGV